MKPKIIEEFEERSSEKHEGKIPFTNLDGRATEYYQKLRKNLIEKDSFDRTARQEPFYEHVFRDLSCFEGYLDTYSELLTQGFEKNKEMLFPNVDPHIGPVIKTYSENNFLNQNKRFYPYFSKNNFDLGKKLDSNSREGIQILKQEKPGLFKEKKDIQTNYDFAHQMTSLMYNNPEFREELIKIQESCEGSGGFVEKYFDKLNFEKQRNERFGVGKELLYSLFEESVNQSKII